jgi:hypothetical protein
MADGEDEQQQQPPHMLQRNFTVQQQHVQFGQMLDLLLWNRHEAAVDGCLRDMQGWDVQIRPDSRLALRQLIYNGARHCKSRGAAQYDEVLLVLKCVLSVLPRVRKAPWDHDVSGCVHRLRLACAALAAFGGPVRFEDAVEASCPVAFEATPTQGAMTYESNLMAFKKSLLAAHGARDRRGALASVLGVDPVREPQIQGLAVAALAEADAVLAMIEDGALDKPVMYKNVVERAARGPLLEGGGGGACEPAGSHVRCPLLERRGR